MTPGTPSSTLRPSPPAHVTFAPAGGIAVGSGVVENLIIAVDILSTATAGATIRTNIADQTYVAVIAPDSVATFTSYTGATVTITDLADTLTVGQSTAPTGQVSRSSADNIVQVLDLSVNQDKTTISSITITRTGTALDTDTQSSGIKLWVDTDKSGTYNAGDTLLGTAQTFSGGSATFGSLSLTVVAGVTQKLLVSYSISGTATTGATLGSQLTSTSAVSITSSDTVALSTTPLASATRSVAASADALTVTHTPPANVNVNQGVADQVIDKFALVAAAGDGITVNTIKVDQTGTAIDSDVTSVKLINDANSNGVYDAGDTVLDTKSFASGTLTFAPAGGIVLVSGDY